MISIEMEQNESRNHLFSEEKFRAKEATKVLIGEYFQNIDDKGRINIPSKFRRDLGESFVVAKGLDNDSCVSIYPKEEWERFLEPLKNVPPSRRRDLQRLIGSMSEECTIDSQGRVVIPPKIRTHAGLEKEIVVVGDTEKVEVWNRKDWEDYISSDAFNLDNVAKIMEELGM